MNIQPLRIYEDKDELVNHNYFEKEHYNISHTLILAPAHKFINFSIPLPTTVQKIVSCKLFCSNGTTEVFDIKGKLKNATDLKIISFTNPQTGITEYQCQYIASDGFVSGVNVVEITEKVCYMKIVFSDYLGTITLNYRSDFVKIVNKSSINLDLLQDFTIIANYL